MAANTSIEWAHHTFNPWVGCDKISPGCKNCYAENDTPARVQRHRGLELWGASTTGAVRWLTAPSTWALPRMWNRQAERAEKRYRVFCAPDADVFEHFEGKVHTGKWGARTLDDLRFALFCLIEETQSLDWLILTKRVDQVRGMVPPRWLAGQWPKNAWLGFSAETQGHFDARWAHLGMDQVPAPVLFCSYEPALAPLRLAEALPGTSLPRTLDWVIGGGESAAGDKARPPHPKWFRDVRDSCRKARVPFFFKQWGTWAPAGDVHSEDPYDEIATAGYDGHHLAAVEPNGHVPQEINRPGGDYCEYQAAPGSWWMARVGKKAAGRMLDGRLWSQVPHEGGRMR